MFIRSIRSKALAGHSDEQLIAAFRISGDQQYPAELFGRYLHLVWGVCVKYAVDPDDRSDMVMSIFEKVLTDLPRADISSFNSWLYMLSRNECVSWLRQRNRYTANLENWGNEKKIEALVVENEASERLNIEEEDFELRLQAALTQLDERQRICIHLFFFERKSYKQISQATGFEVSEVKSHLQNGKRRLKSILSNANR